MNLRFFGFLGILLSSFYSLFAESFIVTSLVNTLGAENGFASLLFKPEALVLIYFILILSSLTKIFFTLLSLIKFDEKAAKTISFMISFIGTSGLFFIFKQNNSLEDLVVLVGGGLGLIIVIIFFLLVLVPLIRNLWQNENTHTSTKILVISLSITIALFGILSLMDYLAYTGTYSNTLKEIMGMLSTVILISFIWFIIKLFSGRQHESDRGFSNRLLNTVRGFVSSSRNNFEKPRREIETIRTKFRGIGDRLKTIQQTLQKNRGNI
jgi:glucan phosphoethanolaminetransferase (alkaline phosphatase superfamily)